MHQSWDKVKFIFCLSGLTAPKFDIRLCIGQNPFSIFLISFMSQFKMKISIYNCCTSCSNNNLSEFHQIMWTWSGCLIYCFCIFIQKKSCVFIECVKIYYTNCNKTKYFRLLQYDKFHLLSLSLLAWLVRPSAVKLYHKHGSQAPFSLENSTIFISNNHHCTNKDLHFLSSCWRQKLKMF